MDIHEKVRAALDGISDEAKLWPDTPDMKLLIDAAVTLSGPELRKMIRVISQLSFHEGAAVN